MQQSKDKRTTSSKRWPSTSALLWLMQLFHRKKIARTSDDSRQLQRLRRFGQASLILLAYILSLTTFSLLGLIHYTSVYFSCGVLATLWLGFAIALLSGFNLRAADKTLSAQMAFCMLTVMATTLHIEPATQILYTPFGLLIIMSCAFRLREKTLLAVVIYALAGNLLANLSYFVLARDNHLLLTGLLHCGALAITMPGFAMLATRVRRLYRSLYMVSVKMESIEEHARRDELTGSFNRRYMMAALQEQKHQADSTDQNLCLAVIDLDHFKRINDEIGHLAGDEVLRTFAQLAQNSVRREDIFGRYGGEEFLLILPAVSLNDAYNTVERIRTLTEARLGIMAKVERKVTVSIGLTQYGPGESVLDLFGRADTAMYLSKTGGRNRVTLQEAIDATD
ncbi:MAG: GGDEF domain-containing protein [Burkholderiales bacterium]|nr:GGDEF domain-containing protein [Burkholderiales bacterium]